MTNLVLASSFSPVPGAIWLSSKAWSMERKPRLVQPSNSFAARWESRAGEASPMKPSLRCTNYEGRPYSMSEQLTFPNPHRIMLGNNGLTLGSQLEGFREIHRNCGVVSLPRRAQCDWCADNVHL